MEKPVLRTTKEIEAKLKEGKPGRHAVGDGAYLQIPRIGKGGTASWVFRFQRDKRARFMGLGPYPIISLSQAREKAREARRQLYANVDPIEARKAQRARARLDSAKSIGFKAAAEAFIKSKGSGWRNQKHARQWTATLEAYAYPVVGDLPIAEIDVGLVLKVLEPIWTTKPETASRVRGRIENVLDYACSREWRPEVPNPARWRGHLDKLLPAKTKVRPVEHHAAMPYRELPGFMAELQTQGGIAALALRFTILTAARTGEVIGAKWEETDIANALWLIPASRMKAGKDHRVPLSEPALEVLRQMKELQQNEYVFPGQKGGLSNMTMAAVLRRIKRDDLTVHGFRSTFRDWAAEQTDYPHEIAEMALAHAIGDKVEAAYRRGDMYEKRKGIMKAWAAFCLSKTEPQ